MEKVYEEKIEADSVNTCPYCDILYGIEDLVQLDNDIKCKYCNKEQLEKDIQNLHERIKDADLFKIDESPMLDFINLDSEDIYLVNTNWSENDNEWSIEIPLDDIKEIKNISLNSYSIKTSDDTIYTLDLYFLEKADYEKTFYQVFQYDIYFNYSSRIGFGIFTSYDKALESMLEGFEKLYPGFKERMYENGINQWIDDDKEFGVMIEEIEDINEFYER